MYTETQHPRVEGDEEAGSKAATTGHVVSGQGKCFHSDHVCQDLHTSTKHPGPLWGRLASCACPPSGCPGPPQRMCSWHCARVSSAYFWVCVWKELCAGMGVRVQTLCLDVCPSEIPQQFSRWTLHPCFPVLPSPMLAALIFPLSFPWKSIFKGFESSHLLSQSTFSLYLRLSVLGFWTGLMMSFSSAVIRWSINYRLESDSWQFFVSPC